MPPRKRLFGLRGRAAKAFGRTMRSRILHPNHPEGLKGLTLNPPLVLPQTDTQALATLVLSRSRMEGEGGHERNHNTPKGSAHCTVAPHPKVHRLVAW